MGSEKRYFPSKATTILPIHSRQYSNIPKYRLRKLRIFNVENECCRQEILQIRKLMKLRIFDIETNRNQ